MTCCYPDRNPSFVVEDRLERLEGLVIELLKERDERFLPAISRSRPTIQTQEDLNSVSLLTSGLRDRRGIISTPTHPLSAVGGAWQNQFSILESVPPLQDISDDVSRRHEHQPHSSHDSSSQYSLPSPLFLSSSLQDTPDAGRQHSNTGMRDRLAKNARSQRDEEAANLFMYTLDIPEAPMVSQVGIPSQSLHPP